MEIGKFAHSTRGSLVSGRSGSAGGCRAGWSSLRMAAAVALLLLRPAPLSAMTPPTPDMVAAYRSDGTWKKRLERAERIGNHRVNPRVVQDAELRLRKLAQRSGVRVAAGLGASPAPPPAWRGMPTTGSPKMFILLLDFSDYPADPLNSTTAINARVFGGGDGIQAAPYESLKSYYYRSSYTKLTLTGDVLAYYRPGYTRASMGTNPSDSKREDLIKEALQYHESLGHDFGQYDNNNDGKIDYFAVLWTGPHNGWSNFWWAYQTSWYATASPALDGKGIGDYVWQWVSSADYPTRNYPHFDPKVLIHETGHALGLPDYYDYDTSVGPLGGVGRLDMMSGNWGDHNCFSKWLLDWLEPTICTTDAYGVSLRASGSEADALVVMDSDPGGSFGEFFMVQNRQRVQNDAGVNYPADGLLIWHVDSRLNGGGTNFLYNNSYAEHKLLRLMEADGLEEIGASASSTADAEDYWISGRVFGPASLPSSARYDGSVTEMGVRNISAPGPTMMLDIFKEGDLTAPTGRPSAPVASTSLDSMTLVWTLGTAADPESGICSYHVQVGTAPNASDVFDGTVGNVLSKTIQELGLRDGVPLYARVRGLNGAGLESAWSDPSAPLAIAVPDFNPAALDCANLAFKTIGPWVADSSTFQYGGSSARSADVGDNGSTYLQAKVSGPGTIEFHWQVSSEQGYDFLTFSLDGAAPLASISGTVPFTHQSFAVPTGAHVLRWTYAKDSDVSTGLDAGSVDHVTWSPAVSLDVNGDTSLDLRDILVLARDWGTSEPRSLLSGGATVGDADLDILLAGLGF